jgi:hypothetical protein
MAHDVKLGQLAPEDQKRDAVHIAVCPVVAGERLAPGEHIGFIDQALNTVGDCDKPLGIVDPFLKQMLNPGDRFFMFLYPGTITSLRHDWEHPAWEGDVPQSMRWIQDFAKSIDQNYDSLMQAAANFQITGDYTYDNSEKYKDRWSAFPEFWKHYEVVTGNKVNDNSVPFTCSC